MAVMTVFHAFSKHIADRRRFLLIPSVAFCAAIAGCATATIDNAVPTSPMVASTAALPAPAQPGSDASVPVPQPSPVTGDSVEKPIPPRSGAPVNTGAYPNINVMPQGVTNQLSDEESANLRNTLYAEQAAQRMPGEPLESYIVRLRKLQKLGSTHAAAALKQIEASK